MTKTRKTRSLPKPKTLLSTKKPSTKMIAIQVDDKPHKPGVITVFQWALKIISSSFILYFAYRVGKFLSKYIVSKVKTTVSEHKRLIINQLSDIIFYVVLIVGVLLALIQLGVQTTTIITVLGTTMVTVGLALQNILTNIFAGMHVALADNFRIGDIIRIYVPLLKFPIEGRVEDLNITYAIIRDMKTDKIIYVPNASIAGNVLENISRNEYSAP